MASSSVSAFVASEYPPLRQNKFPDLTLTGHSYFLLPHVIQVLGFGTAKHVAASAGFARDRTVVAIAAQRRHRLSRSVRQTNTL